MKIFVINLPHRTDKKEILLKQASESGLDLEIVEAVNGSKLSESELKTLVRDYPECAMTKGVIGCALSHLKVYKKAIDENLPVALLIEDDAIPHKDLLEILQKIEALDKNTIPQVYLFSSHYYASKKLVQLNEKYSLHQFIDGSQGHGYAFNRKAAESLYKNLRPVTWEADKWYYFQQLGLVSVACVVPHIIKVNGAPENSDLYHERAFQNRKRRKYLNKLRNVVSKPRQIRKVLWKIFRKPFLKKS